MSIRKSSNKPEINIIKEGFKMFDTNKEGRIEPKEVIDIMKTLNIDKKHPLIYRLIKSFCNQRSVKEKKGIIPEELISYIEEKMRDYKSKEGLQMNFDVFREEKNDKISLGKFYLTAKEIEDEELEKKVKLLIDKTKSGRGKEFDFNEFCKIMKNEKKNNCLTRNEESIGINKTEVNEEKNSEVNSFRKRHSKEESSEMYSYRKKQSINMSNDIIDYSNTYSDINKSKNESFKENFEDRAPKFWKEDMKKSPKLEETTINLDFGRKNSKLYE